MLPGSPYIVEGWTRILYHMPCFCSVPWELTLPQDRCGYGNAIRHPQMRLIRHPRGMGKETSRMEQR